MQPTPATAAVAAQIAEDRHRIHATRLPTVVETPLELEPITRDDFIDDLPTAQQRPRRAIDTVRT
jgi:hypothetical protein